MAEIDARVLRGMEAQLGERRRRLDAGERPLGWKLGLGAPAALERFGAGRPLVGFLTDATLLDDGARAAVAGWAAPKLEAEIAVHLGADVGGDATAGAVADAIAGLAPAIELADLDPPPADVEAIVAGNVFHRHVVLGPVVRGRRDAAGVSGRVLLDGEQVAATDDPSALVGDLHEVLRLTAELLDACGERLRAGDVVITGSVTAPVDVRPGQRARVELGPLGALELELA